jgi:hypothetical protein
MGHTTTGLVVHIRVALARHFSELAVFDARRSQLHMKNERQALPGLTRCAWRRPRQSKDIADILFELAEFAAGSLHPRRQRGAAQLPAKGFVPFQTLVFATATTGTWLITVLSRWKRDASSPVATIQARIA